MSFTNKVAVITGASGGIGAALAKILASEGCKLGLIARRESTLRDLAERLHQSDSDIVCATADISERGETLAAFETITQQLGRVDLLIANAGMGDPDQVDPFDAQLYDRMMRVNFVGMVNSIEAVLPAMLQRKQGHLTAISSLRSYKGMPGFAGYGATKAAIRTFMDGLRVDLSGRGIAVTTICPGFVNTEMTRHKTFRKPWMMEPEEAARRIVWAIRRKRKVYNFPWQLALMTRISQVLPDWVIDRVAPR